MKVTANIFEDEGGLNDKIVVNGVCMDELNIKDFVELINTYLPKHTIIYCKRSNGLIQIIFEMDEEDEVEEYEEENICRCGLGGC